MNGTFAGASGKGPGLLERLQEVRSILREDPYNRSREHTIRKLTDIRPGEGQWRIRIGDYRIRYDIFGREVVFTPSVTVERYTDPVKATDSGETRRNRGPDAL